MTMQDTTYLCAQSDLHAHTDTLTVMRYSAARLGLLKLAFMARTTSSRSYPNSIRLVMACSYASPNTATV